MARLFIALPLPQQTREEIERVVGPLRAALPTASWTRPESMHVTLAFLGEQAEGVVEPLARELRSRLQYERGVELVATQCGFFPNPRRPRVAWVALEPEEPLKGIARHVRAGLRAQKIDFDDKAFVPHLTLARLRDPWTEGDVHTFAATLEGFATTEQHVGEVVIFHSQLSPKGAIHTPLQRIALQ